MLHKDHFTDLYDSIKAYNNFCKTGCARFFSLFLLLDFMFSSRYNEQIKVYPCLTENNRSIAMDSEASSHGMCPGPFNTNTWFGHVRSRSTDSVKLTWNGPVVTTNTECWKWVSIPSRYKLVKIQEWISEISEMQCPVLTRLSPPLHLWPSTSWCTLGKKDKHGKMWASVQVKLLIFHFSLELSES